LELLIFESLNRESCFKIMTESLLEQMVEPFAQCLTEDAAKKIVALRRA